MYEARMRRRAITSDTVTGQISNIRYWRKFSWIIIGSDSLNLDGNNGEPMDIFDNDVNNDGCKYN